MASMEIGTYFFVDFGQIFVIFALEMHFITFSAGKWKIGCIYNRNMYDDFLR